MLQLHDGKTSRFVLKYLFWSPQTGLQNVQRLKKKIQRRHPYKFWNTDWNLTQRQSYTQRPSSWLKTSVTVWCLKGMIQILSRGNNTNAITAETVHQLKIVETSAHFGAYSSASTHTHTRMYTMKHTLHRLNTRASSSDDNCCWVNHYRWRLWLQLRARDPI